MSSWLGLNAAPLMQGDDHQPGRFFAQVWGDSILADAMFVAASLAAAFATFRIARRVNVPLALVAGFALQWLAYLASYLLLTPETRIEGQPLYDAFIMMVRWGWPGLVFAASAPALAARWQTRSATAASAPAGS